MKNIRPTTNSKKVKAATPKVSAKVTEKMSAAKGSTGKRTTKLSAKTAVKVSQKAPLKKAGAPKTSAKISAKTVKSGAITAPKNTAWTAASDKKVTVGKKTAPSKSAPRKTASKGAQLKVVSKKVQKAEKAADFKLTDWSGKSYSLSSWTGSYTVLFFYPKDDTPGCTVEAIEFQGMMPKFKKAKIDVVGISGGDDKSKAKFCKKHDLALPLLSDTDFKVAKAYGAYGKKSFMGRTFNGIFRKTFLLDKSKKIVKVWDSVKPETHAKEVFDFISSLGR